MFRFRKFNYNSWNTLKSQLNLACLIKIIFSQAMKMRFHLFRCQGWIHEPCSGLSSDEWTSVTSDEATEWTCQLCEDWDPIS